MDSIKMRSIPSLYIQQGREQSTKIALSLTRAKTKIAVRVTGGCGNMEAKNANGMLELFSKSFKNFEGVFLFGGTRMIMRHNHETILPGITETAALIKIISPTAIILGVVPRSQELKVSDFGMIVSDQKENDFVTIIHPDQDICLLVQQSIDQTASWEAEYEACMDITENLREFAGWKSLLVSYNGGTVTAKEIEATAKRNWPVLLISGSGRKTDEYASDKDFLKRFSNVYVCQNHSDSLRRHLTQLGAVATTREFLKVVSN